jgi:LmeA-like phospholipid-binding
MLSDQDPQVEDEMSGNDDTSLGEQTPQNQSHLITRILTPAVRFWVRSQLDHVEGLTLTIDAGDRQLLSGTIQQLSATASQAVYQGIHLSQIQLISQKIQTNLRQVLRGKPFRLLAKFPVAGKVELSEADFNASLEAPLLATAIASFLIKLLQSQSLLGQALGGEGMAESDAGAVLKNSHIRLNPDHVQFTTTLEFQQTTYAIALSTQLHVEQGNRLKLDRLDCQITPNPSSLSQSSFPEFLAFDLGSEVLISDLSVLSGKLVCQGQVMVMP